MCGIVYIKKESKPANNTAWKFFNQQKERGTDGFGYIAIQNGQIKNYIRRQNKKEIKKELDKEVSHEILFHHRIPTSVINLEETAHPIKVSNEKLLYDYYVLHNGIITNSDTLKKEHEKQGFNYSTIVKTQYQTIDKLYVSSNEKYNDSESLAIELSLYLEKQKEKMAADGQNAFICLQADKNGKTINLFFGRNEGNPLKMDKQDKFLAISSAGSGKMLDSHKLYAYNYETKKISEAKMEIGQKSIYESSYFKDWGNFGFKTNKSSSYFMDEEEDFVLEDENKLELQMELLVQKEYIESQLEKSAVKDNFDLTQQLESELELIKDELKEYESTKLFAF